MGLTEKGYELPTLVEVLDDISARQRTVFPDINLDPSTPDAQLNGLFAEVIMVAYEVAAGIYNGLDPRVASGIMLDRVCALTGVKRKKEESAQVTVKFSGTPSTVIHEGLLLEDNLTPSHQYKLEKSIVIGTNGEATGIAKSIDKAFWIIPPGSVINILTPVYGVDSVTNDEAGIPGREIETDLALRMRRQASLAAVSTAMVDSVASRILEINDVVSASVYENKENTTSPNGIPPHSIYCVVVGGDDDDVAEAIMHSKSLGCGLYGDTSVEWYDTQGMSHTVKFQRPTYIDIYLTVSVVTPNFNQGVIDDAREKIMQYISDLQNGTDDCTLGALGVGDDVYASTFYPAFNETEEYTVQLIKVGDAAPAADDVVTITIDEVSSFDALNIEVVEA